METTGRYHVIERTGAGDIAEVFRAYAVMEGGVVRSVDLERPTDAGSQSAFVDGAQIAASLAHENVVRVLDFARDDRGPYIVKESIAGRSLATLLERARASGVAVDPMAAMYIGVQILGGLTHVHTRTGPDGSLLQIVHQSLEPASIAVGYAGEIRIDRFDFAKTSKRNPPASPRFTYQSPEQANGSTVDHRSDIFSVGLLLWEILAGRSAYPTDDARGAASRGVVPPLGEAAPQLQPALVTTIERALTVDPNQRHPSAAVFRDELARLLFGAEPTYSAARLASIVSMVLGSEQADDRRRDADARKQLAGVPAHQPERTVAGPLSSGSSAPAPSAPAPEPAPSRAPSPAAIARAETAALPPDPAPVAPEPKLKEIPAPEPEPPRQPTPMPAALARAETAAVSESVAPAPLPPIDGGGLPIKKIAIGVAAVVLIAGLGFTFSSGKNTRIVGRKLRTAFVGRKPGGTLTIESIPPGALVTLDEEETGRRTPLTIENLESELVHDIALNIEGEKTATTTVAIKAGEKRAVTVVFEGAVVSLNVKTVPEGAELWLDGKNISLTPANLSVRTNKETTVKLRKLGYVDFEQAYTPKRGEPINLDVTLEKTPELLAQEAAEAEAVKAMEAEKRPKKKRRRRRR